MTGARAGARAGAQWADLIGLACGIMRMAPADFWSMTPREFDAAARPFLTPPGAATSRGALDALMRAHPDTPEDMRHGR